jgi:hypothetical protein
VSVAAAGAMILAASAASAATAIIDGITVNDYGHVNPAGPDYAQPGVGTGTAQIQIGQVNVMPPNPPEFGNPGWAGILMALATRPTRGGTSKAAR